MSLYTLTIVIGMSFFQLMAMNGNEDFIIAFNNQETKTVQKYFKQGTYLNEFLEPEMRNNLAQQALSLPNLKTSFITMIIENIDTSSRNKLGETTLQTAHRFYLAAKLSKKQYDLIEQMITEKNSKDRR